MILHADHGNVARAHVKIKPIALSTGGKVMNENEQKSRETLPDRLKMSTPNADWKERERSTGPIKNGSMQLVLKPSQFRLQIVAKFGARG